MVQSVQNKWKIYNTVGRPDTYSALTLIRSISSSQFKKRQVWSCVQNHYYNTHPHSVAWNHLPKQHKKHESKMGRNLIRCYRKCSKWLPSSRLQLETLLTLYSRCGNCLGAPGCLQPDDPIHSGTKRELWSARLWKLSAKFSTLTLSCIGAVLKKSDGIAGNTNVLFVEYSSSKYSTALVPRPANPSEPSTRIWKPWKFKHLIWDTENTTCRFSVSTCLWDQVLRTWIPQCHTTFEPYLGVPWFRWFVIGFLVLWPGLNSSQFMCDLW